MDKMWFASLSLVVINVVGCGKDKMAEPRPLPVEAARNALIAMLRDTAAKRSSPPGSQELFRELGGNKYITELQSVVPQVMEDEVVTIGDWTCNCKRLTFTATFSSQHRLITVEGSFAQDAQGVWGARVAVVTLNPKPEKLSYYHGR